MSTYVLVHGAWHWHDVVPRLEAAGHDVVTVDLPGHSIDTTPIGEVTLDSCVERVGNVLDERSEPVILVDHSMAGVVVTQASARYPENTTPPVSLPYTGDGSLAFAKPRSDSVRAPRERCADSEVAVEASAYTFNSCAHRPSVMSLVERALETEHRDVLATAEEFATDVVAPRAEEIERADEFPRDVMEAAGDYGLLGILLPEQYGGLDSDFLSYCLAVERVAEESGAVAESIQGHTFATLPISRFGTDAQREEYLESMIAGESIGAMLLTEPGAGSSPSELETVAEVVENGYSLTGEKAFGTNAGVANVHLVVARKRPQPDDSHGVSVFLAPGVDDLDGFDFDRTAFMGMRGHVTGDSQLDGAEIPTEAVLGEVGAGFRIAMGTIDMARTGLGAIGTGIARAAFDRAVDYAGTREQGGEPVGTYQAVQVLVADMDARLDAARHLVYASAAAIANGEGSTRTSSKAKFVASDTAEFVTRNAMQVHGGKGYRNDLPLERYYRDARILGIIGGTTEIQKTTVAKEALDL